MMKNIATSVEEKRSIIRERESILNDVPSYPHGLKLRLDAETIEKIGFSHTPVVGERMSLQAIVEVTEVSKNEDHESPIPVTFELQITDMELGDQSERTFTEV